MSKRYLGDGVYADFDGCQLKLTIEDGMGTRDTIYLEDKVYGELLRYVSDLQMEAQKVVDATKKDTKDGD